jgi:hypothetical protein
LPRTAFIGVGVHQPPGRGSDAAKAEDSADSARQHAVLRELIKSVVLELEVVRLRS